jgi:hypothetical protein
VKKIVPLALGVLFGLGSAVGITYQMNALDPHMALAARAQDRLYVSVDCPHCQRALAALEQSAGARAMTIIPLDEARSPERDRLCGSALRSLRARDGNLLLRLLPDSRLCGKLVRGARQWLESSRAGRDVAVPAWVLGAQLIEPGWSSATVLRLEREGVLTEGAAAPRVDE